MARSVEKVPGWVEKLLIPMLESRIRGIVKEEIGILERIIEAKFQSVDRRFESIEERFKSIDARFESVNARIDSLEKHVNARFDGLEKRIDVIQRLAVLEAQVKELRERQAKTSL